MEARIKHYSIADSTALKEYLRAAEAQIEALSDEELDQAEALHRLDIAAFLTEKNRSQIIPFSPSIKSKRSRKSIRNHAAVVSVVLMAALTLFVLKWDEEDDVSHWQSKGSFSSSAVCEVSLLQNDKRIVLEASSGFIVQALTKIYLFTNCKGPVTVQSLERGIWVDKGFAEVEKGLLVDEEGYVDFRNYLGEELRLKMGNGMSEEFSLITAPQK